MRVRALAVAAICLLITVSGSAKDKAKRTLPPYVLSAQTVTVIIDPDAGRSPSDPQANQVARQDVENALQQWGRYQPQLSLQKADLIIVVRRGTGKLVSPTIRDSRQNTRPGAITPGESTVSIGAQHPADRGTDPLQSAPQTEVGSQDDSFTVYDGRASDPLNGAPAWRYIARDGLKAHAVPAVAEFRKAVVETEQAIKKQP